MTCAGDHLTDPSYCRFGRFSPTGPHRLLVARRSNQALGYATSQPYRDHDGFRETVEVSIALDVSSRGQGIGTALYHTLFECLASHLTANAKIAWRATGS